MSQPYKHQCRHLKFCVNLKAPHSSHHFLLLWRLWLHSDKHVPFIPLQCHGSYLSFSCPGRKERSTKPCLGLFSRSCFSPFRFINRSPLHPFTRYLDIMSGRRPIPPPEEDSAGSFPVFQESYISILNPFTLVCSRLYFYRSRR